jgi:hypothetical protein
MTSPHEHQNVLSLELLQQWIEEIDTPASPCYAWAQLSQVPVSRLLALIDRAMRFGAIEEMHAICAWLDRPDTPSTARPYELISPLLKERNQAHTTDG